MDVEFYLILGSEVPHQHWKIIKSNLREQGDKNKYINHGKKIIIVTKL